MKKLTKDFSCLLGVMLCLTGCLEKQYAEADAKIATDRETLSVPSDDSKGVDAVKDTVWVDANRSWSAVLGDDVDWVTIDNLTDGRINLSRTGDKAPIALSFKDNPDKTPRTAKLKVFSEAGNKVITIVQDKLVNRLSIDNEADEFLDLDYVQATYELLINTNCDWTIAVKEGSEIQFEIPTTSGSRSTTVDIIVKENPDMEAKTGALIISAPECTPIEVPFSQIKSKPYIRLVDGPVYTAEDGIQDYTIQFKSNSDWSASIDAVDGYPQESVTLAKSKGTKADTSVEVLFPASVDFSKRKASISVKFTVKGAESVYATIEQTPAIRLPFGDPFGPDIHTRDAELFPKNASTNPAKMETYLKYFPFSKLEKLNPSTNTWEDDTAEMHNTSRKTASLCNAHLRYTLKNGGFYLGVYSTDDAATPARAVTIQYNLGLSVSNKKDAYIQLPGVPGYKLSRIRYWQHSSGCEINIADANGTTVMKSAIKFAKADAAGYIDLKVDGATSGEAMKFTNENGGWWINISDLILYYE